MRIFPQMVPLFWARLTANLSFEAPRLSTTFFDRLEVFSNVIDLITTLVRFISASGGDKFDVVALNKMSDLS